ncbi:MAG TPA: 1-acyl-sn-glycerol-3-phosphate acyltransferase [Burkholderiales bacterium]|nr:1-acyl-sn-glycerol-3-phosphate acyltransferase [Burkholderiales bacterium]
MGASVMLPMWLVIALGCLSAAAVIQFFLLPGVRWYFRRKMNRVIDEVSTRFNIEIPEFKRTRRQVLIDRLFHDEKVQLAITQYCAAQCLPRHEALRRVNAYAREIVPSFNAYAYFRWGYRIAKFYARWLYRVRLGYTDSTALAAINPRSSVVFVMNHRSNMDYVLVAFLAAERTSLSYAVGEWARIWPLHSLIRSMGAYFVRRNSGDALYRTVLQRYVQMATEGGVPQAVYPEGGLSADGKLRAPRLGLLDYMLKAFNPSAERDLVFIPVGINYDRVLEDRTLLRKLDAASPRRGWVSAITTVLSFFARNTWLLATGRWYRYGYACVNFGRPLSMREYVSRNGVDFRTLDDDARHRTVAQVGQTLMDAIRDVIPVLPVSLVATVFVRGQTKPFAEIDLKTEAYTIARRLEAAGAHVYIPRSDLDYAIGVGLRMLTLRHIVRERDGLYSVAESERPLLEYYANAIAPLVDALR